MSAQVADFWVWQPLFKGEGVAFAEDLTGLSLSQYAAAARGRRLRAPLPSLSYGAFSSGPLPDVLAGPVGLLTVSERLRAVLDRESGAKIQFIPARLRGRKGSYSLANVLDQVACFDRERSRHTAEDGSDEAVKVKKLVLTPVPPEAPGVFHVPGLPGILVFRRALKEAIEEETTSAGRFVEVSKFQLGYF